MTTQEMHCPHKDKISDCSGCMAELNAVKAPDRLEGEELHDRWYSVIDEYIYEINRLSQRNRRQEREEKIHALVELIVDFAHISMTTKQTQASPEQFLREFANKIAVLKYDGAEKTIKGWAKLLKLREDAARLDELENMTFIDRDGAQTFMPFTQYRFTKDGLLLSWEDRIAQLTTPNNTSNTLEEKP